MLAAAIVLCTAALEANPLTRKEARKTAQELVGIADQDDQGDDLQPYYIFSRGKGKGFVIASGDDSVAPILGYTEQGDYDPAAIAEPLRQMLSAWETAVRQAWLNPQPPAARRSARARAVASFKQGWEDVGPLVKTHWKQDYPYNLMTPLLDNGQHCATGCVATAGSQVAYYFHKDCTKELQYDTPTYGYGVPVTVSLPKGTKLNWGEMKLSGSGTEAQNTAVATLMYALGTSAWLTYGESTSGHNEKMGEAIRGQLHISSTHYAKTSYSQEDWEKKIYDNLKNLKPMLYSGVNDTQGGHSVVLDGYQASTGLYHFNFGWGGNSDGYYTVDDETGMNGFNGYQDLVCDFTPQEQNMTGQILNDTLLLNVDNIVRAKVKNSGTLRYSGFNLYSNNKTTLPTRTAAINTRTVVEPGTQETVEFKYNPTSGGPHYLFLYGARNKQPLDTCLVEYVPSVAHMTLHAMDVETSAATEEADGRQVPVVFNTTVRLSLSMSNAADATFCQPQMALHLEQYDRDSGSWSEKSTVDITAWQFGRGERRDTTLSIAGLDDGACYRVVMDATAKATEESAIDMSQADGIVYFSTRRSDMTVAVEGRHATLSGHWDNLVFAAAASDKSLCSYDLTALSDLSRRPATANSNALLYATAAQAARFSDITNVIVDGACDQLTLHTGCCFKAPSPFTAHKAALVIDEAATGNWTATLIPFDTEVPYGVQMKVPVDISKSMVNHEAVRQVGAMTPVVMLTDRDDRNKLEWTGLSVGTDTVVRMLTDNVLCAATVEQNIDNSAWLVATRYRSSIYFRPTTDVFTDGETTIAPFTPYVASEQYGSLRSTSETLADSYYRSLANSISEAYAALSLYPGAPQDAIDALQQVLKTSEDLFTWRTAAEANDITAQGKVLDEAVRQFREAAITGISSTHHDGNTAGGHGDNATFSLSGQRTAPHAKGLLIERKDGSVRKIIVR